MTPRSRRAGLSAAARRIGPALAFCVLPVALALGVLAFTYGQKSFLYDFHGGLYDAGRAIVHGHSPYSPAYLEAQAALRRAGAPPPSGIDVAAYPPPVLLAAVPFSLLPYRLAAMLFAALSIAALALALRLLGVSDWRCYGVTLGSWPVLLAVRLGSLTPLIVLGAAIAWRWRRRLFLPAVALASIVAAKLFPWTLGGWLLARRRWRLLGLTVLLTAAEVFVAWAVIGFKGMTDYPHMLGNLSFIEQGSGVSLVAALLAVGVPVTIAKALALSGTAALLALAWRASRTPEGERRAFGLAAVAALVGSPLVWPHYLPLVYLAIALMSPRLSAIWFVPLLAYLSPVAQAHGNLWEILPYLAIEAIVTVSLCVGRVHVDRRGGAARWAGLLIRPRREDARAPAA